MFYSKKAETFNSFSQYKIFVDDKAVIDFIEKIPSFLKNNPKQFQGFFFNFLFDILNKDMTEKFNESFIKKFIVLTETIIKNVEFASILSTEIIEQFLEKMKNIILLKNDNDYQNLCFNILKNNSPLWLFASDQLLKIAPFLIENFKMNKKLGEIFKILLTTKKEKKSTFF